MSANTASLYFNGIHDGQDDDKNRPKEQFASLIQYKIFANLLNFICYTGTNSRCVNDMNAVWMDMNEDDTIKNTCAVLLFNTTAAVCMFRMREYFNCFFKA